MTDETQPTDTQVNEEITKNEDKNDTESNKESEREARFNSEDILRKRRERFGIEDEPESANRPQIGDVELDQIKPPKKVRKTEQPKKPEAAPTSSSYERGAEVTLDEVIEKRKRKNNNNNNNGNGGRKRGGRRNNRPRRND